MNIIEIIYDANTLYESFRRAQKSSPWKAQTQKYEINYLVEIAALQKELKENRYKSLPGSTFIANERGKVRLIHGAQMHDRVMRHSFCDFVLVPTLRKKVIYDNYASLEKRGTEMGRKRLRKHLRHYYITHGSNDGYILLIDFSGFYDNMVHEKVLESVKKYIDDELCIDLLKGVLKTFEQDVSYMTDEEYKKAMFGKFSATEHFKVPKELKTGEKFLPKSVDIGDPVSQIVGVYFPTVIDMFIKVVMGLIYYGRYMDDSFVISRSKEFLVTLLDKIEAIATEMGIIINRKKTRICKLSQQFQFLQHRYFLTDSGRVVEKINPKRITCMRRKLKKLRKKVDRKEITLKDVEIAFKGWFGSHSKYMSKLQRNNIYELYNTLFVKTEE